MITNMNYLSSVVMGIFVGSVILFASRIFSMPITGIILAIVFSSFVTAFVYNPTSKKNNTHTTLRGTSASIIFSIIFSLMLTFYYLPKLGTYFATTDLALTASIAIILLITVIGGLIIGTIGGSIGSTFRDLYTVYLSEKNN